MNKDLLRKHVADYLAHLKATPEKYATELQERTDRSAYYRSWTAAALGAMLPAVFDRALKGELCYLGKRA